MSLQRKTNHRVVTGGLDFSEFETKLQLRIWEIEAERKRAKKYGCSRQEKSKREARWGVEEIMEQRRIEKEFSYEF